MGEFVVARGDAAPVLDTAEIVFDFVASSIKALGAIGLHGGIAAARNDRQSAFVLALLPHFLAVGGLAGRDGQWRSRSIEHLANDLTVVDLRAGHCKLQRTALAVDNRMDCRGATAATAATDADRLLLLPPFALLVARWDFTIVLLICSILSRNFAASASKNPLPDAASGQYRVHAPAVVSVPALSSFRHQRL